jgi:hypothetical protein
MSNPPIIYKKFHKYISVDEFKGIQWFALADNYGTEYGDITKAYKFKREPKLLNIGDADVRVMIENEVQKDDPKMVEYCHPDEQYSGTRANTKYHNILKDIFGEEYDGTIIDHEQLHGNETYPISDLEGPSEIVIWKDYNDLLEEQQNNDIGKGINKLKKTKDKNRRRTKRRMIKRRRTKRRMIKRRRTKRATRRK